MSGSVLRSAAFYLVPLMLFLAACGEDDGEGGDPDLFLGLSGFVIFCIVAWLVVRALRRRG